MISNANKNKEIALKKLPYIFIAGGALGFLGNISRADYNLPLFVFAFAVNYLAIKVIEVTN